MCPARLAAVLLALASTAGAAVAQAPAGPFPEGPTATTPERTVSLPIAHGEKAIVASYRFKPRPGLTHWFIAQWCGVTVAAQRGTSKPILLIGTGQTETVTCLGLKEAGAMPPDGHRERIGLVYRTASPNYHGLTPVLLVSDPVSGDWTIDHTHDDAFGRILPEPNLASMRRILSTGRH